MSTDSPFSCFMNFSVILAAFHDPWQPSFLEHKLSKKFHSGVSFSLSLHGNGCSSCLTHASGPIHISTLITLTLSSSLSYHSKTFFAKVLKHKYSWCSFLEVKSNLLGISTPCSIALAACSIAACHALLSSSVSGMVTELLV